MTFHYHSSRRRKTLIPRTSFAQLTSFNKPFLTIITPSYRVDNLTAVSKSIRFEYVCEWIIVYDGVHVKESPRLFAENRLVSEYVHEGPGCSGNPQRNFALDRVKNKDSLIYFLDDDNVIHPNLYELLDKVRPGFVYTFDQERDKGGLIVRGNRCRVGLIDTAMILCDYGLIDNLRWIAGKYAADGLFVQDLYRRHPRRFRYCGGKTYCYYNAVGR